MESCFAKKALWQGIYWAEKDNTFQMSPFVRTWKWKSVVEGYSNLGITFRKDRLPAISAMANQFRRLGHNSQCLAGLWRDTFFYNVLWHASPQSAAMPRPSERIAPTWSWASTAAGVTYFSQPESSLGVNGRVKLLDAVCVPVYEDETMNLKSGHAIISAPWFNATVERKEEENGKVSMS